MGIDFERVLGEAYRIARAGAQVAAGFFGATAIGVQGAKPITGSPLWDAVIGAVLTAFALGASRHNEGLTVIPGVRVRPTTAAPSSTSTPSSGNAPGGGL